MASNSKKPKLSQADDVVCYIHELSPIKTSKAGSTFFNATLQTESGYETLVSWQTEKYQSFRDMQEASTPVSLENLQTMASFRKPGTFDLKFSYQSKMAKPKRKLTFTSKPPQAKNRNKTISEVLENSAVWDKVDVIVKVTAVSTPVPINNTLVKMTTRIADATGSMQLTLWNKTIDEIAHGRTYKISNVTVRYYDGKKTLSTNPESTLEEHEALESLVDDDITLETKQEIISATVNRAKICPCCSKEMQVNESLPTVKCPSCSRKLKTQSVRTQLNANVICADKKEYTLPEGLLQHHFIDLTDDVIEDELLLNFNAVVTDGCVVKLIKCD